MMNDIQQKEIAIVGGGPGGLTLARLLEKRGIRVTVYERDVNKDVRVQGATLDLHEESGLAALREAGLMAAFEANYRPGADRVRIMDKHAAILLDEHVNAKNEFSRPEIDRGPLRKILLDALDGDTVCWDRHLIHLGRHGDRWRLEFQNGSVAFADLVIAADGANSRIRPLVTSIEALYAGVTGVEGTVYNPETTAPQIHDLLKGGKIFAFGDEKSLIVSAKGDGSLQFYTGCKTAESWWRDSGIDFTDKAQVLAWFTAGFSGWDPVWLELFAHAEPRFAPRPMYYMPLDQQWEALPDITLLGDAAHLMPPYAGEGVNMAMLDALELSLCLTDQRFPDTHAAIAAYEKQMRARAAETAAISLEQTASLHSPRAIADMMALFGIEAAGGIVPAN
jgi:2-polyprenyl-6-methoxyphenol hydroxylase-like FAD-dependent oxidoreductase